MPGKKEKGFSVWSLLTTTLGAGRTRRGRKVEKLRDLRVIVDVSCVEVFINGGRDVFSTRFYPEGEGCSIELQAPGSGGRIRTHRATAQEQAGKSGQQ